MQCQKLLTQLVHHGWLAVDISGTVGAVGASGTSGAGGAVKAIATVSTSGVVAVLERGVRLGLGVGLYKGLGQITSLIFTVSQVASAGGGSMGGASLVASRANTVGVDPGVKLVGNMRAVRTSRVVVAGCSVGGGCVAATS